MPTDAEILLQELLSNQYDDSLVSQRGDLTAPSPTEGPDDDRKSSKSMESHTQWALGGNGKFIPVGPTVTEIPAGIYETFSAPGMWGLERAMISSDGIYLLPDMATETVLNEVNKFWSSEDKYRAHSLLYKRGLLLWGPPGGGKTVAIKLLMNELVKQGGIVLIAQSIPLLVLCLKAVRRIEPKRNLIVVFEDIDEIINSNGESVVLSVLDGENNIDNVLHLATTNYPGRLGARIINRPSRFDRIVMVGMPSNAARRVYLEKATNKGLSKDELTQWVTDTKEMSIAHLRELVAAVYCLGQPYDKVIGRLQEMATQIKDTDEFKRKNMGFSGQARQAMAALGSE